jgi:transposase
MNAILFLLRTGCQWNSLDATGICSCSSAYRRFREWVDANVFFEFWKRGLLRYDKLEGINWRWVSMDSATTKAPLGGGKNRTKPDRSRKGWNETERADRGDRDTCWPRCRRRQQA